MRCKSLPALFTLLLWTGLSFGEEAEVLSLIPQPVSVECLVGEFQLTPNTTVAATGKARRDYDPHVAHLFRLSTSRWGTDETEAAKLQWNARRVLTLWGTGKEIRDYARKEWSGMISGYYLKLAHATAQLPHRCIVLNQDNFAVPFVQRN